MSRNYKREYNTYQGKPDQIKKRSARNKARRKLMKEGKVSKGDGNDVGHKKTLKSGGGNGKSNLKVQDRKSNRSEGGRIGDRKAKARGGAKGGRK